VPDSVWSSVHGHFSPEEITDLTLLIVAINGWNRFAIAFRRMPG
jgi:alkylhydroperoxidase family enzyme